MNDLCIVQWKQNPDKFQFIILGNTDPKTLQIKT